MHSIAAALPVLPLAAGKHRQGSVRRGPLPVPSEAEGQVQAPAAAAASGGGGGCSEEAGMSTACQSGARWRYKAPCLLKPQRQVQLVQALDAAGAVSRCAG